MGTVKALAGNSSPQQVEENASAEEQFTGSLSWYAMLQRSGLTFDPIVTDDHSIVIRPKPYVWEWAQATRHGATAVDPWVGADDAPLHQITSLKVRSMHPADFLALLRERSRRQKEKNLSIGPILLPAGLSQLADRIYQSRSIIALEDPDDGTSVDEATWLRASSFVARIATAYWEMQGRVLPIPAISDGPEGSVDVTWRHGTRQMLINFPVEVGAEITLAGIDTAMGNRRVRDQFSAMDRPVWILLWLTS
jgi:hypothetical protein